MYKDISCSTACRKQNQNKKKKKITETPKYPLTWTMDLLFFFVCVVFYVCYLNTNHAYDKYGAIFYTSKECKCVIYKTF